jgi:hypothetical protein
MIANKETYEAAAAIFAEAKQAAAEIRIPGWTVYEVIPRDASPIPVFQVRYKVTESVESAMSKPMTRTSQYLIVEEKFAADGSRFSTSDDSVVDKFRGYGLTGWIRDMTRDLHGGDRPECHDRWFHVRIRDYVEEAIVLDEVLQPAEWLACQGRGRGEIRFVFEAGKEEPFCDGDCCCGDSDSDSDSDSGDSSAADSDDE